MYSFAHLIEFQQEKEEQIVSEPSFSPFQIISRGKKIWAKFFDPPSPLTRKGGGSYRQKSDLTNFLAISDYFQRKFYFGWDEFDT